MPRPSVKKPKVKVVLTKVAQSAEDRWMLSGRLRPEVPNIPNEHLMLDLVASFGRSRREILESLLLFPRNVDCIESDTQRREVCKWLEVSEPSEDERVQYVKGQVGKSSSTGDAWMNLISGTKLVNRRGYHALRYKRLDEQVGRAITQERYRRAGVVSDAASISGALRMNQIGECNIERTPTGVLGMDILGGQDEKNPENVGWCAGDLVLIGGEPGVGKSKLMIKMAAIAASPQSGQSVLYNQGEFLLPYFKQRYCQGVLSGDEDLFLSDKRGISEIIDMIYAVKPRFVFLDSKDKITECNSQAGWKRTEKRLRKIAHDLGCTIFIVTHLNKDGGIMGGRGIEHDVDVVMHVRRLKDTGGLFEASCKAKNRSGATGDDRVSIFRHFGRGVICVKSALPYKFEGGIDSASINPLTTNLLDSLSEEEKILAEESELLAKISASGMDSMTPQEIERLGHISEWRIVKDDKDVIRKQKDALKRDKPFGPEPTPDDGEGEDGDEE